MTADRDYAAFLESKALVSRASGIANAPPLNPKLKEHESLLTSWALRRGRAAVFADTGLGKGWIIMEWARAVAEHTRMPTLILAPLAVSQQFERESLKLYGGETPGVVVAASQDDVTGSGVYVTNYQKLHKFNVDAFGGVALDESSILKSLDGKMRRLLIDSLRDTPFKLSASASPSPNDHTELGGQSEFLGVMTHQEMLATFFVHDGGSTQDWRIKGHARDAFWRWVCSWGAIVKFPSDIGCSDEGYRLPPLRYHEHIVPATADDIRGTGMLFAKLAEGLQEQRAARRGTLKSRCDIATEIANGANGPAIVWCDLNVESEYLRDAISGSVEVTGSQNDDDKERRIGAFVSGQHGTLVSKPSICGWGLNLQFVRTVVFCGVSHSFEMFYQAVRRCWRFGVDGPVDVHVISSELEGRVVANLKEKQRKAEELSAETRHYVAEYIRTSVMSAQRETLAYNPNTNIAWPSWLASEEQCLER